MSAVQALCAHLRHSVPGFDLDINLGLGCEIGVLFGPSGAGKTMALRLLAGLTRSDESKVILNGRVLSGAGTWVPPQKRKVGFVFQHQALFPHMTALGNIVYGARGMECAAAEKEAHRLMQEFKLEGLEYRLPQRISGGQRQRVALARALIAHPELLLLDEPFSALDHRTRMHMGDCLARAIRTRNIPVLLVTHDHVEATALGSKIFDIVSGRLDISPDITPKSVRLKC